MTTTGPTGKAKLLLLAATMLAGLTGAAMAGNLKIESWRNDDAEIWKTKIIPAFNKKYPDIKVDFVATPPKEYNAALNARLQGGTAGDLITCRPFDASLDLYNKGNLVALTESSRASPASPRWPRPPGPRTTARPRSACRWAR